MDNFHKNPPIQPSIIIQNTNNQSGPMCGPCKSKMTYILLAVFLGGLGVHSFYAGYTLTGLVQLILTIVTAGLGWFILLPWIIIEIIIVNRDSRGIPFV